MTDLQSLIREAQRYGKLGAVVRWNKMASELSSRRGWNPQLAVAGDAIAEAYAVIERLAGENAAWRRSHDVWCEDLAKAEAEVRKWEWVATHQLLATGAHGQEELQDRVPSVVIDLLARYEEAER